MLAWSQDGQHLAVGSNNLELWKLEQQKMVPVKTFVEDFIDLRVISWSPDNLSIAYGGLSVHNTIKIRNLEKGSVQSLAVPLSVCGLSFDPFGKYLLVLTRSNILEVYNSSNLQLQSKVSLHPGASPTANVNTVK